METPVDEHALASQKIIVIHFHCAFTVILMMARLRYSAVASCLDLSENKCVSLSFYASCLIKVPTCQHGLVVKLVLPPSL